MTNVIHYLENADGRLLAQALKKSALPKLPDARHVEVKLEPYQIRMLEDGLPAFLLMTQEQRAAAWRATPPRAFKDTVSEARIKEEALAKLRETLPEIQLKITKKVAAVDLTGMKWNMARSRWEPDPDYDPKQEKKPELVSVEVEADSFQTQHGSYLEMRIKLLAKANPRKTGTKAFDKWEALSAFLKKSPTATAAEIFAATPYQKNDLHWDVAKKSIKITN